MGARAELDAEETLKKGIQALDPVLAPHGFEFVFERMGKGSGGHFAFGKYVRGDRSLELHFRYSLGLVTYRIGECSLDHESYMRFLGAYGRHSYPDFPSNPLESFQSLASDLQNYCEDFVSGDGIRFRSYAEELKRKPRMFSGLP